ncbi:hypothetical protein GQ53DRAFT_743943 [Thozetella sp. PMI_491]|nr:hypothetical protein GQ53DRAFT_743943 [Thozetella sp. PMI_491]
MVWTRLLMCLPALKSPRWFAGPVIRLVATLMPSCPHTLTLSAALLPARDHAALASEGQMANVNRIDARLFAD